MKKVPVLVLFIFVLLLGSALGTIKTSSYVEYVEIGDYYYGGHINWEITGQEAALLRNALKFHYDWNHDLKMSEKEMVAYLKNIKKTLINQTVGTVIIRDIKPLHDWGNEDMDVSGIWNLDSSDKIIIKMRFSGVPVMHGSLNSLNLSAAPLASALNTTLNNSTLLNSIKGDIQRDHTEIGASFTSYTSFSDGILLRLVLGNYYYYSGSVPDNERIERVNFSAIDNPLVLFIILLVMGRIGNLLERRSYDRHINEGSTFTRRKKINILNTVLKVILVILYLFGAIYFLRISGFVFIGLCVAYALIIGAVSEKLYSMPLPSVKRGILMVEDVYLLSKSGILISHETRRLKPDVDEDVISSMLVAIQDFVRESFKDESNVELKTVEFGDKKILIERGKHLILAVVMRGEVDRYVQYRVSQVLKEIEKKYADILPTWKGNVEKFRGVREILRKIWE